MADADNSAMSSFGGLMRLADPELLMSIGMGLMAGAKYGSNAGEGLLQGLQTYQGMKTSALQRQLMQQQIQTGNIQNQRQQMMLQAAQQALGQGGGQAAPPMGGAPTAPPSGPFLPGVSQMPPAGPQGPQTPQGLPSGLAAPSMDQIYGSTYAGSADPNYMRAMAMFSQDPAAALLKVREDQLKSAQQQYAPTIAKLDTLIKSDKPSVYMKADPQLQAAWPQLAQTLGFDPQKDYNDQNVRLALTHARNQLAGSLQEPTVAPVTPEETIQGPLGSIYQRDPVTGKMIQVRSEEPLKDVLVNGQPTAVRASQAEGKQPFNQVTYGSAQMQGAPGALLAAMDARGISFPGGGGRTPQALAMRAQGLLSKYPDKSPDEIADMMGTGQIDFNGRKRTAAELSEMSAAANAQMLKLEKDFASLDPLIAKLPNAPAKVNSILTNLKNNWSFGGDKDSAEIVGWLKESAGEYAKIISGAAGKAGAGETSIKDAISQFQAAYSQGGYEGLKNVIMQSGQHRRDSYIEGLRSATVPGASVGGGPTAAPKAPANTNAKGWTLHRDAHGNLAYVSPDGKQFEEVE